MNRRIPILILLLAVVTAGLIAITWLFAQDPPTADSLNEGTWLEYDATNEIWRFKWWGRAGRTFVTQHSEDLMLWNWVPVIESGDDSVKDWALTSNAERFFMRLRYTDIPTTDPENDDFDGEGVSNIFEILTGFNPFGPTDAKNNGMPDEQELFNAGKFTTRPPSLSASIQPNQTTNNTREQLSADRDCDFTFTGHFYHVPTSLHLALYRAYYTETGPWLSVDPIRDSEDVKLYGNVDGDVVNLFAPLGLEPPSSARCIKLKASIEAKKGILQAKYRELSNNR